MNDFDNKKIQQYIKNGATIIDVRTKEEYDQAHIESSKHIPLDVIPHNIDKIKEFNTQIITVCRSGNRSGKAANFLNQMGIDSLNGGPWENVAQYIIT